MTDLTQLTRDDVTQLVEELPDEVRRALVSRELSSRRETARIKEQEKRDLTGQTKPRAPARGRFRSIQNGDYTAKKRPPSSPDDRKFVPGVLRHWRLTHDLSPEQAGARIGYSPTSCSWRHWEAGYAVPSYNGLLRVIAATGLGTRMEPENTVVDPTLLLEARRAEFKKAVRRRHGVRAQRIR